MRPLLATVGLALLIAVPAHAVKPQQPPGRQIIAICPLVGQSFAYLALASDGVMYQVSPKVGTQCQTDNLVVVAVGNPFGGPPPATVVGMWPSSDGAQISLSNGDVWGWCSSATPTPLTFLNGNIFTMAGTAAPMSDFAPLDAPSPAAEADETPEAVRPGAVK